MNKDRYSSCYFHQQLIVKFRNLKERNKIEGSSQAEIAIFSIQILFILKFPLTPSQKASQERGGSWVKGSLRKETGVNQGMLSWQTRGTSVGRWIDARLATGGWFCRRCVRARTFVRHSHSLFLHPFSPPSFFSSHLLLSLPSPSSFIIIIILVLRYSCAARGGTILLHAVSPVNRYFVSEERSRINLSAVLHAPQASDGSLRHLTSHRRGWLLLVYFPFLLSKYR